MCIRDRNNTIPGFSRDFVKNVLYNPVYMGKIAYGRRRTEKKQGTRNEMHVVEPVSYTHLDVYKRQKAHSALNSVTDSARDTTTSTVFFLFRPRDVYKRQG